MKRLNDQSVVWCYWVPICTSLDRCIAANFMTVKLFRNLIEVLV